MERGTLNLIKGLGGALLREKIVAAASRCLAIIVDGAKLVDRLGAHTPVPVEVVAFGLEATQSTLEVLGATVRLRLGATGEPFVTDSGNRTLDCSFGPIADPARLEERIRRVVGVVESGLFIGRANVVFVAETNGVHRLESPRDGQLEEPASCERGSQRCLFCGATKSDKGTVPKRGPMMSLQRMRTISPSQNTRESARFLVKEEAIRLRRLGLTTVSTTTSKE